jgi:hypothetical protein
VDLKPGRSALPLVRHSTGCEPSTPRLSCLPDYRLRQLPIQQLQTRFGGRQRRRFSGCLPGCALRPFWPSSRISRKKM